MDPGRENKFRDESFLLKRSTNALKSQGTVSYSQGVTSLPITVTSEDRPLGERYPLSLDHADYLQDARSAR
jgi:hypothetical protein